MAFPINGMAPGLAAAPGHCQALGTKEVAWPWGGPEWGPRAASFARPGAAARPGAIPLLGKAITLIGNAITLNGNAGVGWGGVGWGGIDLLFGSLNLEILKNVFKEILNS